MLELPAVTLVCIDCIHHALALAALEQSMLRCRFARVLFVTDRALAIDELDVRTTAPLTTKAERFAYLTRDLPDQVTTTHVLLIQWDAFAVNAAAWDDAFVEYDLVTAAGSAQTADSGRSDEEEAEGIALLSTALLRALATATSLDLVRAAELLAGQGSDERRFAIAPAAIRERFAFADDPPAGQPFAFQGLYNMWMLFQPADLDAFLAMATPDILSSDSALSLALNLRALGRDDEARKVISAMHGVRPNDPVLLALGATPVPVDRPAAQVRLVGRNDPCPCGSGRRYKACHGALTRESDAARAPEGTAERPPMHSNALRVALPPARGRLAVLFDRARAAFERHDLRAAQTLYRAILDERADDPNAIEYLGVIATKARRYDEAEPLLARALALKSEAPEFHNNLGLLFHSRGEFERAIDAYRKALARAPGYAPAHNNLGLALQESLRLDDAIGCFRTAVRLQPDFAEAHWNLALALLLDGRYAEGLVEHEWRLRVPQHRAWWERRREFPMWAGEPLEGKRILILAEQGMGDMIQFVRYAMPLAGQGATVVVETANELLELVRSVPGVATTVPRDGPYPPCDVQTPVMSLPLRFGLTPQTIPAHVPYVTADAARVERWRQSLAARDRPRIGIAWAGNPEQARDRYRSMPLAAATPLLGDIRYEWLGVQKGAATAQIAALPSRCGLRDLSADIGTFADLAALIECLDLVVTVDTAVVHVAGALGKPTLLLLDAGHDWRWPRSGTRATWYPTVHIVRQSGRGDWPGAIAAAAERIEALLL